MRIPITAWDNLNKYVRQFLLSDSSDKKFDYSNDQYQFNISHKGFYIGLVNSRKEEVCCVGKIEDNKQNIISSCSEVVDNLIAEINEKKVTNNTIATSSINYCVVLDSIFLNNSLLWDENSDGIYFQWGDKYHGVYLPYQIHLMNCSKIEVMNRLCSWKAQVPSNLWRLPEGLCFKLMCESYTSFS